MIVIEGVEVIWIFGLVLVGTFLSFASRTAPCQN